VTSSFLGPHSCLAKTTEQQRNQVVVNTSRLRQSLSNRTRIRNDVLFPQRSIRVLQHYTTISTCSDKWIHKQTQKSPTQTIAVCVALHAGQHRAALLQQEGTRTPTTTCEVSNRSGKDSLCFFVFTVRYNIPELDAGQPATHITHTNAHTSAHTSAHTQCMHKCTQNVRGNIFVSLHHPPRLAATVVLLWMSMCVEFVCHGFSCPLLLVFT
jgi:hypothetical protein